jgi:gag-polyprotein putative aspartyl protease
LPPPSRSFTLASHGGILRVLITDCHACAAFDPSSIPAAQQPQYKKFKAIWDTGATASVVTQSVVTACGLKPTGMTQVHGVHGVKDAETFLINIGLPNGVAFANVEVTLGELAGADMLVGMDIITMGDFSVTNVGQRTVFSFRVPSQATVDFVKEATAPTFQHGIKHKHKKRPPKQFGKNKGRR